MGDRMDIVNEESASFSDRQGSVMGRAILVAGLMIADAIEHGMDNIAKSISQREDEIS